ncbi:uncharacterized protein [Haliotis asinina]|uniref:uncharacterized protein n=1 Tax=Haliotis asinina TaxID=109174 RepID=UPI003531C402
MTDFRDISLLMFFTSLICCCGCEESLTSVIQRLNQFDRKLHDNKKEILGMEENVLNLIEVSKTEMRTALKENIQVHVREAMVQVLKGDALQDLVSSEVVSELRQLQKGYREMEIQSRNFSKLLKDLQDNMVILQQPKYADVWSGRDSCENERRRILVAPLWSYTNQQFRQLNIHTNSLSVYQHLTMKGVSSVVYIARTRKLLIGLDHPDKLVSSPLDASYTAVVREGIRTFGMAVDEERDIVFLTTEVPRHTISRMSTEGKDFTAITDLSGYGKWPVGITLDKKRKKIYACNGVKMFTVNYDGQGLATLARGSFMYAVIFAQTAGVLYYNNEKTLMKMTVSSNVSTEVTTLSAIPWSMRLYRGTIYYGGFSPVNVNSGSVGSVDVTFNTVPYILKSIHMAKIRGLHIQFIP